MESVKLSYMKNNLSFIQLSYAVTRGLFRDYMYLQMANIWSQNSFAQRAKVGALIVKDGQIISDGYNGMPSGLPNACEHAVDDKLVSNDEVLHAESNALMKLCSFGAVSSKDAIMFCTYSPCINCAKLIIQAGIKAVHFSQLYRDIAGLELLMRCGIKCYFHQLFWPVTSDDSDTTECIDKLACNELFYIVYHDTADAYASIYENNKYYLYDRTLHVIYVDNCTDTVLAMILPNLYKLSEIIPKIGLVSSQIMCKQDLENVCKKLNAQYLYIENDL